MSAGGKRSELGGDRRPDRLAGVGSRELAEGAANHAASQLERGGDQRVVRHAGVGDLPGRRAADDQGRRMARHERGEPAGIGERRSGAEDDEELGRERLVLGAGRCDAHTPPTRRRVDPLRDPHRRSLPLRSRVAQRTTGSRLRGSAQKVSLVVTNHCTLRSPLRASSGQATSRWIIEALAERLEPMRSPTPTSRSTP